MSTRVADALTRLSYGKRSDAELRDLLLLALLSLRRGEEGVDLLCACGRLYQMAYACDTNVLRAIRYYERALALDPTCVRAMREIGIILLIYRDSASDADHWFRRALAVHDDVDSRLHLAGATSMLGRKEEALRMLDEIGGDAQAIERAKEMRADIEQGIWDPVEEIE